MEDVGVEGIVVIGSYWFGRRCRRDGATLGAHGR